MKESAAGKYDAQVVIAILAFIFLLTVLFAGSPDLMDAIIQVLGRIGQ